MISGPGSCNSQSGPNTNVSDVRGHGGAPQIEPAALASLQRELPSSNEGCLALPLWVAAVVLAASSSEARHLAGGQYGKCQPGY